MSRRRYLVPPAPDDVERASPPSFSVIIAAYQAEDVIAQAVESALNQTKPPEEIVVCDDGSTDDLVGALEPFAGRITLIQQPNGGEASAKNTAAQAASSDFVVILDADDVFMPQRLEALGDLAAARPDLDILTTDAYLEAGGKIVRRCYTDDWPFATENQRTSILERNFVFGLAAVRRSTLLEIGGFDGSIVTTTDWDCWIRLILSGSGVGAVDEPLAVYRLRETSLSANRTGLARGKVATLEKAVRSAELRAHEPRVASRSLARYRRELALEEAREALREGQPDARRLSFAVALRTGFPARTRLKAAAGGLFPRAAGRIARRQAETGWIGASGLRVRRDVM